jgi:creatinine amidohydrolase
MTASSEQRIRRHRFELLRPLELRQRLAERSVAYIPLGTLEWHGEHLPVGLDALTAHGVCLEAAAQEGGVVLPPLYYGTGGGHASYPFTIMMDDQPEIAALLEKTLLRLQDFGIRLAVLFSGHFADTQLDMIASLATSWNGRDGSMKALVLAANRADLHLRPDHAGLFETTLLGALWPERVDLSQLASVAAAPCPDDEADPYGEQRHDPSHPLYGVFGADPRD